MHSNHSVLSHDGIKSMGISTFILTNGELLLTGQGIPDMLQEAFRLRTVYEIAGRLHDYKGPQFDRPSRFSRAQFACPI